MTGTGHTTTLGNCSTTNRVASTGYSYDASGNTTADPLSRTFVYDGENKQSSVSNTGGAIGVYSYDGDGKRVKKVDASGTTLFFYDATGRLVEEAFNAVPPPCNPGDECSVPLTVTTSYVYAGGRLLSTESFGNTTYLTADHLGTPRINTNGSGSVVARHDYMPFGEEIATSQRTSGAGYAGDFVRKKFTGYERDGETGLDFAQARLYANAIGRFTTTDPMAESAIPGDPQTFNRYIYVRNAPVVMTDPSGKFGDYFSYSGKYLGSDGKDDQKVYFAVETRQTARHTYVDANSIKETSLANVFSAQDRSVPLTPGTEYGAIQNFAQGGVDALSDIQSGSGAGALNALVNTANGVTDMIFNTSGGVYFPGGGDNPLEIPRFTYANDRAAKWGTQLEVGLPIATGVAGGVFGAGGAPSIASEEAAFVGPKQLEYAVKVRMRALTDPRAHNFPYSFDSQILSNQPVHVPGGYRYFRQAGTMNKNDGIFELGVRNDFVIDHRVSKSNKR